MSDCSAKVQAIFRELVGERSLKLRAEHYPADINTVITNALCENKAQFESDLMRLDGVGFHLTDWQSEAAFIVALILFPEKFTGEEIREGVEAFLIHAPAHVIEAARLGGYPTENIFTNESDQRRS